MKCGSLAWHIVQHPEAQVDLAAAALLAEQAGAAVTTEGQGGLWRFLVAADGINALYDGDLVAIQSADRGVISP
ncbi:hypothetical protein D3C87_2007020 [compost metagenome]